MAKIERMELKLESGLVDFDGDTIAFRRYSTDFPYMRITLDELYLVWRFIELTKNYLETKDDSSVDDIGDAAPVGS